MRKRITKAEFVIFVLIEVQVRASHLNAASMRVSSCAAFRVQRVQLGALDALCALLAARPEGSLCERLIAFLVRRANDTGDDAVRCSSLAH